MLRTEAVAMPELTTGFREGTNGAGRLRPDVLVKALKGLRTSESYTEREEGVEKGLEREEGIEKGCSKCRWSAGGCARCNAGITTAAMLQAAEITRLAHEDLQALDKLCMVGEEGDAGGVRRKVYVTDNCGTSERLRLAGVPGSDKW